MKQPLAPLLAVLAVAWICAANATDTPTATSQDELARTIGELDGKVFDAYNRCDLPGFERYFAPDVEFYHDTGGVTHTRQQVVDNTRKYICGKVRRELVAGTLHVYHIKDYGAIEEGEHRFCELASGRCEGIAKFVMVWQRQGDDWRMTRVLSYGHRAVAD
ncbi:MAG: nuclear transport factor 2 family protein [Dokdonella sp.]